MVLEKRLNIVSKFFKKKKFLSKLVIENKDA